MKTIKFIFLLAVAFVVLSSCKKEKEPETPVTTVTPPVVEKELNFKVTYHNGNPDTLIPVEGIEITISSNTDLISLFYQKNSSNIKKTDVNGVVKFTYTELKMLGISGSMNLQVLAQSGLLCGSYNGHGYLKGDPFLFDDRSTYPERGIAVRAYYPSLFEMKKNWKLVYASVNDVSIDISNTCNKDDYMVYKFLGSLGQFEYRDSSNTCTDFPSQNPKIFCYNQGSTNTPDIMSGNYNPATKAIIRYGDAGPFELQVASVPDFWGNSPTLKILSNDTLYIKSTTNTQLPVVKKFVPMN